MDGARTLVDPDGGNYYEANAGAVVVLDARTGGVVAMASNPGFNPNDFIAGDADKYFEDPNFPLLNRALNPYVPGSTFKTITSIAMLQSGLFPEGANHAVSDYPDGCFHFGNDEERCNAGKAVLGTVDLPGALTVSSDVYFYSVGNEFWNAYRDEGQARPATPARPRRRRAPRRPAPGRQRHPAHRAHLRLRRVDRHRAGRPGRRDPEPRVPGEAQPGRRRLPVLAPR